MAKPRGGLTEWFGKGPKGDWVDIGAPKKKGKFQSCCRSKLAKYKKITERGEPIAELPRNSTKISEGG